MARVQDATTSLASSDPSSQPLPRKERPNASSLRRPLLMPLFAGASAPLRGQRIEGWPTLSNWLARPGEGVHAHFGCGPAFALGALAPRLFGQAGGSPWSLQTTHATIWLGWAAALAALETGFVHDELLRCDLELSRTRALMMLGMCTAFPVGLGLAFTARTQQEPTVEATGLIMAAAAFVARGKLMFANMRQLAATAAAPQRGIYILHRPPLALAVLALGSYTLPRSVASSHVALFNASAAFIGMAALNLMRHAGPEHRFPRSPASCLMVAGALLLGARSSEPASESVSGQHVLGAAALCVGTALNRFVLIKEPANAEHALQWNAPTETPLFSATL